jgi:DNA-binding transcriptional LysR family regulator
MHDAVISVQSTWNVVDELRDGSLQAVLRKYTLADALIYAVYPPTWPVSSKVRKFIDEFLLHAGEMPY